MTGDRVAIVTAEVHARALAIERLAAARERNAAAMLAEAVATERLNDARRQAKKEVPRVRLAAAG